MEKDCVKVASFLETKMDGQLPALTELALIGIFNRLPLADQLTARLVCKRWMQLIDENLVRSARTLILFYRVEARPVVWRYNNQPANLEHAFVVDAKINESERFWQLFRNIKRLNVILCPCYVPSMNENSELKNFFDRLNDFSALEHLEEESFCFSLRGSEIWSCPSNFPNLKTLFYQAGGKDPFEIVSPKLEQLGLSADFRLTDRYRCLRNSLKLLKVWSFSYEKGFELPNLEALYFNCRLKIEISDFQKLREIHQADLATQFHRGWQNYDQKFRRLIRIFNDLFRQKRSLRRDDLQIYFEGIRCEPGSIRKIATTKRVRLFEPQAHHSHFIVKKADLEAFQQNRDDFKVENLRMHLEYTRDLDEVIAAMSDEQIERLARSVDRLTLVDSLNSDLLRSSKFEKLFRYVRQVSIDKKRFSKVAQFELLPSIVPNVVWARRVREDSNAYWFHSPLPSHVAKKFKGLKDVELHGDEASASDFKEMLGRSRFVHGITICTGFYKAYIYFGGALGSAVLLSKYRWEGATAYDIADLLRSEPGSNYEGYEEDFPNNEKMFEFIVEKNFFYYKSLPRLRSQKGTVETAMGSLVTSHSA